MDKGELSMDQAEELTAKYICENEEWLKIALHVFEAKEAVRRHLIGQIWKGVKDRILGKGDGIEGHAWGDGFYFWHNEAENLLIYGEVERRPKGPLWLIVGIYLSDDAKLDVKRREAIRQCYDAAFGKQCNSNDRYLVKDDNVGYDRGLGRWDWDAFLRQAVMSRDEIESYLAGLLLEIYERMEGDMKRIAPAARSS